MYKWLAATAWSASMAATAAFAQTLLPAADAPAPPDPTGLGAVVVTANRMPAELIDVASSITLITADDIALKQEQTLPDVLKDVPGLNLVQTGGPGGQTSVFLRGTNANHVKVLVDGIDVSDPSSPNGAFDFGQVLTAGLDRVEVLRGPQSGLYGSDAIGGVISISTQSGEGPPQLAVGIEGGSFATFNQNAGVSGSTGPYHYAAEIAHLDSGATPVTPRDLLAPGEPRNDDAYDNITASTKLGYEVTSDFDLGLVARYTNTRLRFTGDDNDAVGFPDSMQSESDTRQYYARGTAHLSSFGGGFDQTLGVAYSSIATTDASPNNPNSYFTGDRVKADWQGDVKLAPGETLVLGAEHESDSISQPLSAARTIESGYAELVSNPLKDLNATAAVRYDVNSGFGGAVTYRLAPTYFLEATSTKFEASLGTGFKAPTLSQMFQNFPSFGFFGNPDLKPETSTGYDIGFEQVLLKDRLLQFGAAWYHNSIKNLIDDNASFTSYANVGRAHTQGVEAFVALRPVKAVSLRLDYTDTEAQDDILQEELLRRPRDKWSLDARWQATRRFSLAADLLSVSAWVDGNREFTIPRLTAPGYTTADLTASYDVTTRVSLYGRVTNLADARYENPVGFLGPSRGVFAGVRARF